MQQAMNDAVAAMAVAVFVFGGLGVALYTVYGVAIYIAKKGARR